MTTADHLDLAAEFPTPDREDWLKGVEGVVLKGRLDAGPEAFNEAFIRQLVHRTEDGIDIQPLYTADDAALDPGEPGFAPFVRGTNLVAADWEARQRVWVGIEGSRAAAELEAGATGVLLELDDQVDVDRLDQALEGVFLELAPVSVSSPAWAAAAEALLALWDRRGIAPAERRGTLGVDPLGEHARVGGNTDLEAGLAIAAGLAVEASTKAPSARTIVVDGTVWHEAGATDAQELAWSTAAGATYLRALTAAGLSIEQALGQLEFRFAATADQFATIAKLRAARRLWSRVAEVSGAAPHDRGQHQHADGSRAMLTRYDPWVNTLRSTVACFAAGLGGAAAVTVQPHDLLLTPGGTKLGRRVARNTQSILLAESNLARVSDPAGGSWFVEHLTDELATVAWTGVQEVERAGGIGAALASGLIHGHLDQVLETRRKALATRRRPLTGLTEFPDIGETPPPALAPVAIEGRTAFPPLAPVRLAEDFEVQRGRADRHTEATGSRPTVFLATLGLASQFTDRATFAKNLFEVAGIVTVAGEVDAFATSGTTVVCLCSTDAVYKEEAEAAAATLRAAGATHIYVAGRRLDLPGVDEEVGMGSDVLDVVSRALDLLGVDR